LGWKEEDRKYFRFDLHVDNFFPKPSSVLEGSSSFWADYSVHPLQELFLD